VVTGPNVSAPCGGQAGTRLDEIPLSAVEVLERLRWCLKSCTGLQFVAELDGEPSRDPEAVDARGLSAALLAVTSRQTGRRTVPSWSPCSEETVRRPALDEASRSEPADRCGEGGSVSHER